MQKEQYNPNFSNINRTNFIKKTTFIFILLPLNFCRKEISWCSANDSDGNYGDFWFRMEKSDILFDDNVTVEIQKTALKDFISEVFTVIGVVTNGKKREKIDFNMGI